MDCRLAFTGRLKPQTFASRAGAAMAVTTLLFMTVSSQVTGLINGLPDLARNLKGLVNSSLDRLDSVIFAAPIFFHVTRWVWSTT